MKSKTALKILIPGFAILTALIFLMSPVQAAQQSASPLVATSVNYQPDPSLNTNVTWAAFNSSMSWNQYVTGSGNISTLNAQPSTFYQNYISVNPSDIIAPKALQNDPLGDLNTTWESGTWATHNSETNVTVSASQVNVASMPEEKLTAVVSGAHNSSNPIAVPNSVPVTDYPSQNLEYDFLTYIITYSAPSNSGSFGAMAIDNSTGPTVQNTLLTTPGTYYFSENLEQIQKDSGYIATWNTTAGKGYSSSITIYPLIDIPTGAPDGTYSLTINGLAITTYPITFGTNSTGATITNNAGDLQLSDFHPDVNNVSIIDNGYSEALSQELSDLNYTQTQTPISFGNYIEQVGHQGTFSFPSAPDLSYSGANFTLPLSVPGSQFQALDVNGVSYLSAIGSMANGTAVLLSSTDPNTNTSYLAYIDYTASQWQSISSPAGLFSIAGIEYYWFIAIGAIASLLGLAGAVRHAHTKADQTERVSRMGPRR